MYDAMASVVHSDDVVLPGRLISELCGALGFSINEVSLIVVRPTRIEVTAYDKNPRTGKTPYTTRDVNGLEFIPKTEHTFLIKWDSAGEKT
jgi:hypothetical protein